MVAMVIIAKLMIISRAVNILAPKLGWVMLKTPKRRVGLCYGMLIGAELGQLRVTVSPFPEMLISTIRALAGRPGVVERIWRIRVAAAGSLAII